MALNTRRSSALEEWLARFPESDGVREISQPRTFGGSGGEDEYAKQFVVDGAYERSLAVGLDRVLRAAGADAGGPALELGCGTGIFTRALVEGTRYPGYYVSDMSAEFLKLTRDTIPKRRAGGVDYVVLATEEINRWPKRSLSLVALRYVLHHVLDWEAFLSAAASLLRPGGVLTFEEPCADGFLLQAQMVNTARKQPGVADTLGPQVHKDLDLFLGMTFWYLRTGVDKHLSEDKHVFSVSRLSGVCRDLGLETTFYPNMGYEMLETASQPAPSYFLDEFRHNFKVNFGFGDETMAFFEERVAPACAELADISGAVNGPCVKGVFVCKQPDRPLRRAVLAGKRGARRFGARGYRYGRRKAGGLRRRLQDPAS